MYYIVETAKSFEQAATDIEAAVKRHGFGVLHIHGLGTAHRSKGISFGEQCKVFEVCNPGGRKDSVNRYAPQFGSLSPASIKTI